MPVYTYERVPVQVQALRYDGGNMEELKSFAGDDIQTMADGEPYVYTLEGTMIISVGDYVVKGIKGEFYPVKPAIFAKIYKMIG